MTVFDPLLPRPDDSAGVSPSATEVERWIRDARIGCGESLGLLVDRCRQYLLLVANRELGAALRGKVGASDIVQDTLLTAQQVFHRFDGRSEAQLRFWLRRILLNKLAHAGRYYTIPKRAVSREQPLMGGGSDSHWVELVDPAPTPRSKAITAEQAAGMELAISQLPEHYRQVIRLRCFDLWSFVQIGQHLQISGDAARKLWCRAIETLRQRWEAGDDLG